MERRRGDLEQTPLLPYDCPGSANCQPSRMHTAQEVCQHCKGMRTKEEVRAYFR